MDEKNCYERQPLLFNNRPDPFRFLILVLICLSTVTISLSFYGFSSIATQLQKVSLS